MSEKLCVFCEHLIYHSDTGGDYAEPAQLECCKGHQLRDGGWQPIYGVEDFRKMILRAETCPDYKQVNP